MATELKARAFTEGETVNFTDYVLTPMETKYGDAVLIELADATGEIVRKCFQPKNSNLVSMLRDRPEATTVTLKKFLTSGEYKRAVWVVE